MNNRHFFIIGRSGDCKCLIVLILKCLDHPVEALMGALRLYPLSKATFTTCHTIGFNRFTKPSAMNTPRASEGTSHRILLNKNGPSNIATAAASALGHIWGLCHEIRRQKQIEMKRITLHSTKKWLRTPNRDALFNESGISFSNFQRKHVQVPC